MVTVLWNFSSLRGFCPPYRQRLTGSWRQQQQQQQIGSVWVWWWMHLSSMFNDVLVVVDISIYYWCKCDIMCGCRVMNGWAGSYRPSTAFIKLAFTVLLSSRQTAFQKYNTCSCCFFAVNMVLSIMLKLLLCSYCVLKRVKSCSYLPLNIGIMEWWLLNGFNLYYFLWSCKGCAWFWFSWAYLL